MNPREEEQVRRALGVVSLRSDLCLFGKPGFAYSCVFMIYLFVRLLPEVFEQR